MRSLYVFAVLFVLGSVGLLVLADEEWSQKGQFEGNNVILQQQLDELTVEAAGLERLEPFPLKFKQDTLSDLFTRAVEAGEVLGAGVRLEARGFGNMGEMRFVEFKSGVQKCEVTVQASMEKEGAAAILTMLEEELGELPASVRKTKVRVMDSVVSVSMDVDLFGR
ncbi:MAG: hypothetical protein RL653_698 [Pseudomonadota bacterium]|jgi:hypothetical protein